MNKKIFVLSIIFTFIVCLLLSDSYADFKEQAVEYYKKARFAMDKSDLDTAIKFYQKSILLEPYYVEAHNDLGIVYEKKGMIDKARNQYKTAINIEPDYASAYMNLAMLEESVGNIEDAVFYWKARIAFGKASDKWAGRAIMKLREYVPEMAEIDTEDLMEEVLKELKLSEEHKQKLAEKHVNYGKNYFQNGDYFKALDEFQIAYRLYPDDAEIQLLLSKTKISIMQEYFSKGIAYFDHKDYESAKYEFIKIIKMLPDENIEFSEDLGYIEE